ncbi:transposable element Tcb1 transposase [Trichonephila clavipes]|nr:transposable element Tcb1 transposase [Trichonephila clavipes]
MQMIRISAQTHISRACGATSKRYLRLGDFDDFEFSNCLFLLVFFKKRSVLSRRIQRSAFDQVSEFDRGRIVAYHDCGLTFREIGSRVGRNQTTVMRICDRWMQEGMTDLRGRSHPLQCTTSREDKQTVRMAKTDRSVTSRTIEQHIESVTHRPVSARTIRRRLQQSDASAKRLLLGLPLTQNRRRLCRQWCDERRMWVAEWNEVVFTDESRICLQHHDGQIRVLRHRGGRMLISCDMLHHTGPLPGIMEWGSTGYQYRTPLGLTTAIFQQDNARSHVTCIIQRFVNHQIELLPWLARSTDLSPIENMWSMNAQRLAQITPPAATPDPLCFVPKLWKWRKVVSPSILRSGDFAELIRTVTCMVLKANDRRTSRPLPR